MRELLEEYCKDREIGKITDTHDLRTWLERKFDKPMSRALFVAVGTGGGQTYKTMWEVCDPRGNYNTPCYFYNENKTCIEYLESLGHIQLKDWVHSPEKSR